MNYLRLLYFFIFSLQAVTTVSGQVYNVSEKITDSKYSGNYFCLAIDNDGDIWLGGDGVLSKYNGVDFTNIYSAPLNDNLNSFPTTKLTQIEVEQNKLWLLWGTDVYTYNIDNGKINKIRSGVRQFIIAPDYYYFLLEGGLERRRKNGGVIESIMENYVPITVIRSIQELSEKSEVYFNQITNNANLKQSFEVVSESDYYITAAGEYVSSEWADYPLLINAIGDTIFNPNVSGESGFWMGGATKNRILNSKIRLIPGKYTFLYHSDNRHAFDSWDSEPPNEDSFYAATILKGEEIGKFTFPKRFFNNVSFERFSLHKNKVFLAGGAGIDIYDFSSKSINNIYFDADSVLNNIKASFDIIDVNNRINLLINNEVFVFNKESFKLVKAEAKKFPRVIYSIKKIGQKLFVSLSGDPKIMNFKFEEEESLRPSRGILSFSDVIIDNYDNIWTISGNNLVVSSTTPFYKIPYEVTNGNATRDRHRNFIVNKDSTELAYNIAYAQNFKIVNTQNDTIEEIAYSYIGNINKFNGSYLLGIANFKNNYYGLERSMNNLSLIKFNERKKVELKTNINLLKGNPENAYDCFGLKDYLIVQSNLGFHLIDETGKDFLVKYKTGSMEHIKSFIKEGNDFFFIYKNGLSKIDLKTKTIIPLTSFLEEEIDLNSTLLKLKDELYWVTSKGLNIYNLISLKHELFAIDNERYFKDLIIGLRYNIVIDNENNDVIWITSTISGLTKINRKTNERESFFLNEGLTSSKIGDLVDDKEGFIWIYCEKIIFKLNKLTNKITQWKDMGQGYNVYSSGGLKYKNKIYFEGDNGIVIIDPSKVKEKKPKVRILNFKINGNPGDSLLKESTIELDYFQNNISFKISCSDLSAVKDYKFKYKLEGWTEGYKVINFKNRNINFDHLVPGSYQLKVIPTTSNDAWNNENAYVLNINIIPPLWGTLWFRCILIMSGLAIIIMIFKFRTKHLIKKQRTLEATIAHRTSEITIQKEKIEEAHQEITDSIAYAKRIQSAILPQERLVKEYFKESFILYKPKDVVAGDFYWMEQSAGKVLFAAADCTGHGVPGAMVSVVCNNALNRSVREYGLTNPGQILDKTRAIVIQEFDKSEEDVQDGMDIALCSINGYKLQYAGAHNPLWIIRDGKLIETKANKQPIGKFDNPDPYTTHSFDLEAGDSIYIFSDGYVDQFGGAKGKKFKSKAFRELLLSIQENSMEQQKEILDKAFENWKGSLEQIDDICVIGVKFS